MNDRKKPSFSFRLTVDLIMLTLFIICLAFRLTKGATHEWAGLAFLVMLAIHTWINRTWYGNLFRGAYSFQRVINTVVNLALMTAMVMMAVGGIINSRLIFSFLNLEGGMLYHQLHALASYWGLVLVGIHAGLHWGMIRGAIYKGTGHRLNRSLILALSPLACLVLTAFGFWASFDWAMGSKLFLGLSFDYWNPERPAALFYFCAFSLFWLYAFTAHWFMEGMRKVRWPMPA